MTENETIIINVDKDVDEKIVPMIDELNPLGLGSSSSERIELFLFAMSLGIKEQKRTPLGKGKKSFIRETSVRDENRSMIYSLLVSELIDQREEEKIDNKKLAYAIAEEYANTGFHQIGKWFDSKRDNELILYDMLNELNEKSNMIFGDEDSEDD